jgi:hypothetical protein
MDGLEARRLLNGAALSILFIRGAERSGGFLEATGDFQRTEQLADINNTSTSNNNHGWATLATALRGEGYTVTQVVEPLESGAPGSGQTQGAALNLAQLNLSQYDAVVFGSNNAIYDATAADVLEAYVRGGGGVLFISDANFGSDWRDASRSDQPFLSRFGLTVHQDNATYVLERSRGEFVAPNHPVLRGINSFDGEGVTPFQIGNAPSGVVLTRLAIAEQTIVLNNGTSSANQFRGTSRAAGSSDASLVAGTADDGRLIGHFDRNTFFNLNGAGTNITRFDNRALALNIFDYLTDNEPPALSTSEYSESSRRITLRFDDRLEGTLQRNVVKIRNRQTLELLPRSSWSIDVNESGDFTIGTINLRSAPTGRYRVEIEPFSLTDDANNTRGREIRFNFTVGLTPQSNASVSREQLIRTPALPTAGGFSDELIGEDTSPAGVLA